MAKPSGLNSAMTSFYRDTFTATPARLKEMFGEPTFDWNDGEDKTNMEWVLETTEKHNDWDVPVGSVFTVYDWKEYKVLDDHDMIEWHIGGHSKKISHQAKEELMRHDELEAERLGMSDDLGIMKDLDII